MWTRVGPRNYVLNRSHWRHLANTTEPSVCCNDAALCQITLTMLQFLRFRKIISLASVEPLLRYVDLTIFKMAAVHHLGIVVVYARLDHPR